MHDAERRRFLTTAALAGAGCLIPRSLWGQGVSPSPSTRTEHPRLFVTATPRAGLRSVDDVRAAIRGGHARVLWERIAQAARSTLDAEPVTPRTPMAGRTPSAVAVGNPDFIVTRAAGRRVLVPALAHLLTGEAPYKTAALRQAGALLDPGIWPRWMDDAHVHYGHPADLRTGMLARDLGLAFDWLYPALSGAERDAIATGLGERALQAYFTSLAQDPWWVHDLNNWVTTIAGGVSVAALALGDEHPLSGQVVEASLPLMDAYLERYGPEGEFNENPAYANASDRPVMFYEALRYASEGGTNRLAAWPFPQTCRWSMYLTLPPGRLAAFGDGKPDAKPWVTHVAAVAGATRDGVLQWHYLHHTASEEADPLELLWYDPTLEPRSPQGREPLGRAFPAHGACLSSRTSWDPESTACVVYGKASREENHEHNDDGQVCIDGYGERLIVDLGAPGIGYPDRYFDEDRWVYYNASVRGHNVLTIGGRERRVPRRERGEVYGEAWEAIRGRLLHATFDDARGGWWQADLTPTYQGVQRVVRTVVHLQPGVVAVLDEAELDTAEEIALRWHTIDRCAPADDGSFTVEGQHVRLSSRLVRLDAGPATFRRGEHTYEAPYDRNRDGDPLEQRRESYVEAVATDRSCRWLSLFALFGPDVSTTSWAAGETPGTFECPTPDGAVRVAVRANEMVVGNEATGRQWAVPLAG